MCVAVFWLNRFMHVQLEPQPFVPPIDQLVRHEQVGARQHGRPAHVAAAVDEHRVVVDACSRRW